MVRRPAPASMSRTGDGQKEAEIVGKEGEEIELAGVMRSVFDQTIQVRMSTSGTIGQRPKRVWLGIVIPKHPGPMGCELMTRK